MWKEIVEKIEGDAQNNGGEVITSIFEAIFCRIH